MANFHFTHPTTPIRRRMVAEDFVTQPFKKPKETQWILPLPQYQVDYLLRGCIPRRKEDRWFAYADGPDERGTATLHIFKSSTGHKTAEVTIEIPYSDYTGTISSPPRITRLVWESDKAIVPGNTPERAIQSIREIYTWALTTQQSFGEDSRLSPLTFQSHSSYRSNLSRIKTALGPIHPSTSPSSSSSLESVGQIVDVPGCVASRPTYFYCPPSP